MSTSQQHEYLAHKYEAVSQFLLSVIYLLICVICVMLMYMWPVLVFQAILLVLILVFLAMARVVWVDGAASAFKAESLLKDASVARL